MNNASKLVIQVQREAPTKDGTPSILYIKETRGFDQCYSLLSLVDPWNQSDPKAWVK
jgi:hypothetical protein